MTNTTKDAHGVTIRCDKYPLAVGDEFTLHSDQARGTYGGYPHSATPGRYIVLYVGGINGVDVVLQKTDWEMNKPMQFCCSEKHAARH